MTTTAKPEIRACGVIGGATQADIESAFQKARVLSPFNFGELVAELSGDGMGRTVAYEAAQALKRAGRIVACEYRRWRIGENTQEPPRSFIECDALDGRMAR